MNELEVAGFMNEICQPRILMDDLNWSIEARLAEKLGREAADVFYEYQDLAGRETFEFISNQLDHRVL